MKIAVQAVILHFAEAGGLPWVENQGRCGLTNQHSVIAEIRDVQPDWTVDALPLISNSASPTSIIQTIGFPCLKNSLLVVV